MPHILNLNYKSKPNHIEAIDESQIFAKPNHIEAIDESQIFAKKERRTQKLLIGKEIENSK